MKREMKIITIIVAIIVVIAVSIFFGMKKGIFKKSVEHPVLVDIDSVNAVAFELKFDSLKIWEAELKLREREIGSKKILVESFYKKIDSIFSKTNEKMVKAFEKMPPTSAAAIIDSLDEGETLRLLLGMRETSLANVLAALPPQKAARIMEKVNELQNLQISEQIDTMGVQSVSREEILGR